ncbi:MAG: bifunctional UDP-N-acetylglucosamine diphosphorylase/glucosamine-1-phosphate N-acetyltransferase GlmU [Elusimicrobiota bacterium]|jgi:bifunctional UDP-N-acetylglucosamine pyrophosphorylase/glucosamine-1-phosphate N-acetyltransferase|nr:bifunctional UDP-N-acetylglucosamine diphosphorylase/glucosamine-1-phosphate N-acetyltransferase GlmU [Elusimicrobiota bacterium]
MTNFSAVILAAGSGTRMKSEIPKVLHKLSGKTLLKWVIDSVSKLKPDNIVIVLGHKAALVEKSLANLNVKIVYQREQKGSAHALLQAKSALTNYKGNILVISGDVPLIRSSTISSLLKSGIKNGNCATVLSTIVNEPFGYGRIVKNGLNFEAIIEEKDASKEQKNIKEINSGIYCFDSGIWEILSKIKPNNVKKEYYVTDSIAILKSEGKSVGLYKTDDSSEVKGINNRKELAEAESILQDRKIQELFAQGVSFIDPKSVYISADAQIGQDTIIYPRAYIANNVKIGKNCTIEGDSYIADSKIADDVFISYSYVRGAVIEKGCHIGPFSHIRPESHLKEGVKVGNFSEIKKSVIKKGAKVNHLSYIGDANIGEAVNIGAGTITCNFDGFKKHKTEIGDNVFVGSNVNLVAPIKVGKNVLIAAGSTITHDIAPHQLAIARAKQQHLSKEVLKTFKK